jgi:hypothetical protein
MIPLFEMRLAVLTVAHFRHTCQKHARNFEIRQQISNLLGSREVTPITGKKQRSEKRCRFCIRELRNC